MNFVIYNPDDITDSYHISIGIEKNRIWIAKADGEGGDFDADKVSNAIFFAIDKFYKENF